MALLPPAGPAIGRVAADRTGPLLVTAPATDRDIIRVRPLPAAGSPPGAPRGWTLPGGGGPVVALASSADGSVLTALDAGGQVRRWEPRSCQPLPAPPPGRGVGPFAVRADGGLVLYAGPDGEPAIARSGREDGAKPPVAEGGQLGVARSGREDGAKPPVAEGGQLGVARSGREDGAKPPVAEGGQLVLWEARSGRVTRLPDGPGTGDSGAPIRVAAFHPREPLVAVASDAGLWLRPLEPAAGPAGRSLGPAPAADGRVRALAFSPDGSRLVAGLAGGAIAVHDLTDPARTVVAPAHEGPVTSVTVSPGGTSLISTGLDGTVRLWSTDRCSGRHPGRPRPRRMAGADRLRRPQARRRGGRRGPSGRGRPRVRPGRAGRCRRDRASA
jgi:hypothetical protein